MLQEKIRKMDIGSRLSLMVAVALGALLISGILGLASMWQTRKKSFRAIDYANTTIDAIDIARGAQVHFKKQVQEWKNVLLRGYDKELYAKYWSSFMAEEKLTREQLEKLKDIYLKLNLDAREITQAIEDNQSLGVQYRNAIRNYSPDNYLSPYRVDKLVRGIDRQPTDNIDRIVHNIEKHSSALSDSAKDEAKNAYLTAMILSTVLGILVIAFMVYFHTLIRKSILGPLHETIEVFAAIGNEKLNNQITVSQGGELGAMQKALLSMQSALSIAKERLEDSFRRVRKLKEDQDGDYFLTSLLTEPLNRNYFVSEDVEFDLILDQKKKFKFRKWSKELGGDLVAAHNITLQKRPYLAFINGDAMGKSAQGAGGALVLGSVFQSIIERTKVSKDFGSLFPELWLREVFIELHLVFKSFEGSMLSSVVIGLLDEKTGFLYFINAEHPPVVLYRDAKATFIGMESFHRKLGHTGEKMRITVSVFPLRKGDLILIGSDGRDDILTIRNGVAVMNEDETLFLRIVESARGNLKNIRMALDEAGQLADDLSLISIKLKGEREKPKIPENITKLLEELEKPEISPKELYTMRRKLEKNHLSRGKVQRALAMSYYREKNYEKCYEWTKAYLENHPWDNKALYLAAVTAKLSGKKNKAIEYSERLLLRDRANYKNIVNLADLYVAKKDMKRASELVEAAEEIFPGNDYNVHLKQKLTNLENSEDFMQSGDFSHKDL